MNVILGAGLSGLAAGTWLTKAGQPAIILEKDDRAGGLARTIRHGDYHFDLGGHRFLTRNQQLMDLVSGLLGDDLLTVPRKSQILLNGKRIDYPLSPANAVFGMGVAKTASILLDYGKEKLSNIFRPRQQVSLEDWVVSQFGRTMFNLYFKSYSEKVWGIDCREINKDWVAQRIDGLSLWKFMLHSLLKVRSAKAKTLTDTFFYPRFGIGQLSDRMAELITEKNSLHTGTAVKKILHAGSRITGVQYRDGREDRTISGTRYLASIPVTRLIDFLSPAPPERIRHAASHIRFRSLVVVALFINRQTMTDLTWMYFPGSDIPFGRIHEPNNWSRNLSPPGTSQIIAEYFCDRDDATWQTPDAVITKTTARHLRRLGFFGKKELLGSRVLRIPYAYPVFDLAYRKHLQVITDYLGGFSNLTLIGRNGMFSYLNMDQAMESGIAAAEKIMQESRAQAHVSREEPIVPCRLLQPTFST